MKKIIYSLALILGLTIISIDPAVGQLRPRMKRIPKKPPIASQNRKIVNTFNNISGSASWKGSFKRNETAQKSPTNLLATQQSRLKPNRYAAGPHSTFKRNQQGRVSGYTEWKPNENNPTGYDQVQRFRLEGRTHVNKNTGQAVSAPLMIGKNIPGGVRKAQRGEIPKGKN